MKKILLPLILLIVGIGSGVGAGLVLKSDPEPPTETANASPCGDTGETPHADQVAAEGKTEAPEVDAEGKPIVNEYAKLNNQFVVPILDDGMVKAMVVLALSIEVPPGQKEAIFLAEPKLRDSFLQAMFDHANVGGFSGNFTSAQNLRPLREDLVRRAKAIAPGIAKDVLIIDIVRQDA